MTIVKCKYFFLFFFLLNFNSSFSDVVKPKDNIKSFKSIIFLSVGMPYATESKDFFKHYEKNNQYYI